MASLWSIGVLCARTAARAVTTSPLGATSDDLLIAVGPDLLPLIVSVAGAVCISLIWHRSVILGESTHRFFPATADVVGPYLVRVMAANLLPLLLLAAVAWRYISNDFELPSAVFYFLPPLVFALMVRFLLVIPAAAVGDRRLTIWESARLARRHVPQLAVGLLVCDVPWSAASFALDQLSVDFPEDSLEQLGCATLEDIVDFAQSAIWSAFMSLAYLRLVRPNATVAQEFS
jgi:hypothetical protein